MSFAAVTTILLVEDHTILRHGLRSLLAAEPDIEVVGEAGDGRSALALARELRPQVVVMDVGLPDLNGIDATRALIGADPELKVIALSMHTDKRYIVAMLQAGAQAYVVKNASARDLLDAIRAVIAGQSYLSPEVAAVAVRYLSEDPTQSALADLSDRQREIVQLLSEGKTSKQIAAELNISVKTVETHRRTVMARLDLHTIADLTRFAIREGLSFLNP